MLTPIKELSGRALNYAVGLANGWVNYPSDSVEQGGVWHENRGTAPFGPIRYLDSYHPSEDAVEAVYLQEKLKIGVAFIPTDNQWVAYRSGVPLRQAARQNGPNPLVAICRCYVALQLGPGPVEVPLNLLPPPPEDDDDITY